MHTAAETLAHWTKMLGNMDRWLEMATENAERRKFPVDVLAEARLAPDQFELSRQVQSACDAAKNAAAYLSGTAPPSHPDTEKTIAELRTRIATCIAYVQSVPAAKLAGAADARVAPPWLKGRWMRGGDYFLQFAMPNFYFHVVTTYAILRHNGVEIGKRDFLGNP